MRLLCLVFFVALVYVTRAQECDTANGWNLFNGKCFRVSRSVAEAQVTWQEARQACLAEGADVATLTSLEEQDFVVDLATSIGFTGTLWIGLNQLSDKSGSFVWADGSDSSYRNWGPQEPRDGGVTNCAFSLTQEVSGDFQRYDYSSATIGLLEPGYDRPTDADGIDTFYFGGGYDKDQDWCEYMCSTNPLCAAYTWYWYHYDYYWEYTCVGRSDRYDILGYDSYGYAGVRSTIGGGGQGWWYAGNCGFNKGFACSKAPGSDTPVTVPPTAAVTGYCPDGYFGVDNKCFKVVIVDDELDGQMWSQAVSTCRAGPGVSPDIASIHSDEENALITQLLQQTSYGVWIGYHYATYHDQWVWADNSEPHYFNWADNEPSDVTNLCVEMWAYQSSAGKWHNLRCDSRRGYVCQTYKDPDNVVNTPPATTPHECADGWTPYWYGCYRYEATARTWESARDNCVSLGGSLVSIHHEAENSAVYLMAQSDFPVWLGLRADESGFYEWVDGWPYGYYMNWDDNAIGAGDGCVVMKNNQKWNDTMCANTHASICKQTSQEPPSTPEGGGGGGYCPLGNWKEYGSNCYYFSTTTFDHDGAIADCRAQGGTSHIASLATIENSYENEFILQNIRSDPYNYGSWIGLIRSQIGVDGFVWIDGSDSLYRQWAPGEPSDPYYENCVEMWTSSYPGYWNDARCEYYDYVYKHYVCKASKGDMPTTPQMPTPGDQDCPSGNWDVWGDNCLLIRPNDYRTWDEALSLCKQMGGTNASLASIHSYEENWYIHWKVNEYNYDDYYNPDVWIGLNKYAYGYPYVWENNRAVDYTNWAPGEPNDQDGSQNCVRMYAPSGQWDDYFCYEYYYLGYVCQVRQDLYRKELEEKGPGFFTHPDDIKPRIMDPRPPPPKFRETHGKHRNVGVDKIAPPPVHVAPPKQEASAPKVMAQEPEQHHSGGQQAGIILGCLVGVMVVVAVVSLLVKRRVQRSEPAQAPIAMNNVLSTAPVTTDVSAYDQPEGA